MKVAESQGTSFREGDILLVRSGWVKAYNGLSDSECQNLADKPSPPAIGVESSEKTLRWIWDTGFAAVAGDMPSFEAWPCQNTDYWLHEWLLAGWGMPIGELFDLERLSRECAKAKRYSFFFSSMPLHVSLASDVPTLRQLTFAGAWRSRKPTKWCGDPIAFSVILSWLLEISRIVQYDYVR